MCKDRVYFYGLLCLSFIFHGMINGILGQMCSCVDSGNCDFTHQCVPEGACIKENVALGKVARISSLNPISGPACLMVNGNTTMAYSSKNCVKSAYEDNNPSWTVDLGEDYTITNISIYPESSYITGLRSVEITVDGQLCYIFPEERDYNAMENVQCTQPQRGRIVKLYSSNNYYIFFCELQVWVCKAGLYGNNCDQVCHCKVNDTCDNHFGTCAAGCADGFYGSSCKHTCGNCTNGNICNTTTGVCLGGCDSGWTPPYCNETCKDGFYGYNCSSPCGNCLGGVCDKINGICPTGCEAGWQNDTCKQECNYGYYGLSCNHTCGKCANFSVCNKTTGRCPDGCDSGWTTPYCNQSCKNGNYGVNCSQNCGKCSNGAPCDNVNGNCLSCEPGLYPPLCHQACSNGTYGQNCSGLCGNCTNGEPCDKVNGTCPSCDPGFKPSLCQQVCDNGTYGQNCSEVCGNCMNGEPCNKVKGLCHSCKPGLKMPLCQQECDAGFFGQNCQSKCGEGCNGSTCHTTSGLCDCVSGWQPHFCSQIQVFPPENNNHAGSIAGGVVGGVLASAGVIVAILLIRRRQCQWKKSSGQANKNGENITNMEPISIQDSSNDSEKNESTSNSNISMKPLCVVSPNTESTGQEYVNFQVLPIRKPEVPPKPNNAMEITDTLDNIADVSDDSDVTYSNENVYSTYQSHNTMSEMDNLQRTLLESLKSDQQTRKQFQSLPRGMLHPTTVGTLQKNLRKNRFKGLFPYDHTRVKLKRNDDDTERDYINANYIRGYERTKAYIAAQGPRDHTVDDMWLMIWQENITQIVMLTNLKENGKDKCTKYWPPIGTTFTYGHVTVTNLSEEMRADFIIRAFSLKLNGFQRQVDQYHYVSWSDHDIPSASSLVNFWRYVKARGLSLAPLLVHCSAGVGRTGTYIALDIAMETATHQREVDVFKIVKDLREDRTIMVQTESQYRFLYEVILEAYTSRKTRLTLKQFDVMFTGVINVHESNKVMDKEFKMLQQMGQYLPKPKYEMAGAQENKNKNRHPDTLPDDTYLAYLGGYVKGRNMYINAVFLSSFKQYRGILLTQLPLPDTLVDIWRLVEDKDVNTIVSIGSKEEQKTVKNFCQYWPRTAGHTLITGPYTVTLTSLVVLNSHLTSYHLSFKKEPQTRDIRLLHYTDWAGEVPEDTSELIQLVENLNASRTSDDKSPVLVQCIDGAARSGLFCVLWDVISRASCDQEIDVYLTARRVQTVRRQAVTSEVQYRYCYKVAQDYHRQRGVYQNTE